jgi:hypothetical protein
MTSRLADPDRQARAVKLMLAVVGAVLMAVGWFRWSDLVGLFQ